MYAVNQRPSDDAFQAVIPHQSPVGITVQDLIHLSKETQRSETIESGRTDVGPVLKRTGED